MHLYERLRAVAGDLDADHNPEGAERLRYAADSLTELLGCPVDTVDLYDRLEVIRDVAADAADTLQFYATVHVRAALAADGGRFHVTREGSDPDPLTGPTYTVAVLNAAGEALCQARTGVRSQDVLRVKNTLARAITSASDGSLTTRTAGGVDAPTFAPAVKK